MYELRVSVVREPTWHVFTDGGQDSIVYVEQLVTVEVKTVDVAEVKIVDVVELEGEGVDEEDEDELEEVLPQFGVSMMLTTRPAPLSSITTVSHPIVAITEAFT